MGSSDLDNFREAKEERNLDSTKMHTALFRKGEAKKGSVYILNKGNSNDMGFCEFEGNSFDMKGYSLGYHFSKVKFKELTLSWSYR